MRIEVWPTIFSAGAAADEIGKAGDADEPHRHADRHAQQHQREQRDETDDGDRVVLIATPAKCIPSCPACAGIHVLR